MDVRELFIGYALNPIDAKGRVAIPADLRAALDANSGGRSFFLGLHPSRTCLIAYDRGWVQQAKLRLDEQERIERAAGRPFDRDAARRRLFPVAEPMPFDSSGRFVLGGFLREAGGLTNYAWFHGVTDFIEIWNPHDFIDASDVDEGAQDLCRWHMKQRGIS